MKEETVYTGLRLLAAGLSSLTVVAGIVTETVAIAPVFYEHLFKFLFVGWLLGVLAVWPGRGKYAPETASRSSSFWKRYLWVLIVTVGFAGLAGHHYWEIFVYVPDEAPGLEPGAMVRADDRPTVFRPTELAAPELEQFALNALKSGFTEDGAWYHDLDTEASRFNSPVMDSVRATWLVPASDLEAEEHRCRLQVQRGTIIGALRRFAVQKGLNSLIPHINTEGRLLRTSAVRPDITRRLAPRGEEWSTLTDTDRQEILEWARFCLGGLPHPVFNVVVSNPDASSISVTAVRYRMEDVNVLPGDAGGPGDQGAATILQPVASYFHEVDVSAPVDRIDLVPPFQIPSGGRTSFELAPKFDYSGGDDIEAEWAEIQFLYRVEIVTSRGSLFSPYFAQYLII